MQDLEGSNTARTVQDTKDTGLGRSEGIRRGPKYDVETPGKAC